VQVTLVYSFTSSKADLTLDGQILMSQVRESRGGRGRACASRTQQDLFVQSTLGGGASNILASWSNWVPLWSHHFQVEQHDVVAAVHGHSAYVFARPLTPCGG
jgi:hypothetical protein